MKIIVWPCVCPVCRVAFSAYLADVADPQRDEVAHDKRALLCSTCERAFLNALFAAMRREGGDPRGLALSGLRLPALRPEAQRAGEPRQDAAVGTDIPGGLFGGVQGMHDRDRNEGGADSVSGVVEAS